MSATTQPRRSTEADTLKAHAIEKLRRAQAMVRSATHDMQNLEGPGYCSQWEQLKKLDDTIGKRGLQIQRLKPPTGVFKL